MNIHEYYLKLKEQTDGVFQQTLNYSGNLGQVHHYSCILFDFARKIQDPKVCELIGVVCSQLELSTLNLSLGMYRQAFTSLRMTLEIGLGAVYLSMHSLEMNEWYAGKKDLNWSSLVDGENGVLSKRVANAFFPELANYMESYLKNAKCTYRQLSEYVHGNRGTWDPENLTITYCEKTVSTFFKHVESIFEILLFSLSCRYLHSLGPTEIEDLDLISKELSHIPVIREFMGGPKDI